MAAIVEECIIAVAPVRVFSALTQPKEIGGWWTNDLNATPQVGTLAEFRFGDWGETVLRFELAALDQDKQVYWIHRFSSLPHWAGTYVTWSLEPVQGGTRLRLTHEGFAQADEAFEQTRRTWVYFLHSLKSYLETGKGTPGRPPLG